MGHLLPECGIGGNTSTLTRLTLFISSLVTRSNLFGSMFLSEGRENMLRFITMGKSVCSFALSPTTSPRSTREHR